MKHITETAFSQAKIAAANGEIPVGAVVFHTKTLEIAGVGHNQSYASNDPTAHAEIVALRQACEKQGTIRLPEYSIFSTLEPCPMCAAAIGICRLQRIYFGAYDEKGGGTESGARVPYCTPAFGQVEIYGGIDEAAACDLLRAFFERQRG
ncbi:MAG: nucleoside deaminase [Alphaproteobacteria bacterium]|nr:nucleoside deaminase [Alphaproteobacteria bacterium]